MDSLQNFKEKLASQRPVPWDQIPDIPLYMDQVVSYMSRQLIGFEKEDKLTAAMINNYIKDGLLPRAAGKKYSREHVAYLTAICVFKQVTSVKDTKILLDKLMQGNNIESFYAQFRDVIDQYLEKASEQLQANMTEEDMVQVAFDLALSCYSKQILCHKLIEMFKLAEQKKEEPTQKPNNKKEKQSK